MNKSRKTKILDEQIILELLQQTNGNKDMIRKYFDTLIKIKSLGLLTHISDSEIISCLIITRNIINETVSYYL